MEIIIDIERLKSTTKKIINIHNIDKYDIYIGLDITSEAISSAISFSKGKPCITKELIERSDNILDHELNLLMIFSSKQVKKTELIKLIRQYRIKGFRISTIISLGTPESETEKELKMLGVKVIQIND